MTDRDETCGGLGYIPVGEIDVECGGCPDCDFEWYRDEQERETPF